MAEEAEPWIAETQALLGALIKRPKLTDALLRKPPFRFLHDIVSEVTKVSGFADGLYDENESNSANIKEKEGKIAYLQKAIDCVSFALATKTDVRPSKVVAGMEPEMTNAFLQLLARAATDPNVDRNAAVQRVLSGESSAPKPVKPKEPAALPPPLPPAAPEPAPPPRAPMPEMAAPAPALSEPSSSSALNTFQSEMPSLEDGGAGGAGKAERPRTARRQPPKVSSNVVKIEPSVAKGAETSARRNIIAEGATQDDDDDDGIVIVNDPGDMSGAGLLKDSAGEGHTKIVKDILETQHKMDEAGRVESTDEPAKGAAPAGGGGIILGRKKASAAGQARDGGDRQRSKDEISKLRQDIQGLCQSTNPLGKSLEYVHEDLESMSRELELWRGQHAKHRAKLMEDKLEVDGALKQLEGSLEEVERQIVEEREKVRALKSALIRNDATISKLLHGVVQ